MHQKEREKNNVEHFKLKAIIPNKTAVKITGSHQHNFDPCTFKSAKGHWKLLCPGLQFLIFGLCKFGKGITKFVPKHIHEMPGLSWHSCVLDKPSVTTVCQSHEDMFPWDFWVKSGEKNCGDELSHCGNSVPVAQGMSVRE